MKRIEEKPHNLIQSYVAGRWFVSTAYRKSSAVLNPDGWYYETIIWEWNAKTKKRGRMLTMQDVGLTPRYAHRMHFEICHNLLKTLPETPEAMEVP